MILINNEQNQRKMIANAENDQQCWDNDQKQWWKMKKDLRQSNLCEIFFCYYECVKIHLLYIVHQKSFLYVCLFC